MDQSFLWMVFFVFAMILLLEAASVFQRQSWGHRLTLSGLLFFAAGVVFVTSRMMLSHQLPSFSLSFPTYFLSAPS